MSKIEPDYYKLLDVVPSAAAEVISKAYRKKALSLHPGSFVSLQ